METLRITEIFHSLQGESATQGWPTVFIRLTGCPLRCSYCDTTYSFTGGEKIQISEILASVARFKTPYVCVTGGEPLAQPGCLRLLDELIANGYRVSLETSGAMDISGVNSGVVKVMDLKTPGSGECERNRYDNLQHLSSADQVKFVITDHEDYLWSVKTLREYNLPDSCEVLFSPAYGLMNPTDLAGLILRDHLPVRFQMQLHKILWGEEQGV